MLLVWRPIADFINFPADHSFKFLITNMHKRLVHVSQMFVEKPQK